MLLVAVAVLVVVAVFWAAGLVLGAGTAGLAVGGVVAALAAIWAYRRSDSVVLAFGHAEPAHPERHARLHNLIEGLCMAAGLPKPRVYVVDDGALNAFATGRDPKHASLAVTTGLLEKLNRVELEGVLAHELAHVKNYDILLSTLAVTLVGFPALVADWSVRERWWGGSDHDHDQHPHPAGGTRVLAQPGIALLPLLPAVARLIRVVVDPARESLADLTAVSLTRYPPGLVSALEKLRDGSTVVHSGSRATAHLWLESPLPQAGTEGRVAGLDRRFDTHPPLDERLQALLEL